MGSIAIVGLEPDATGTVDERAVARLRAADVVVVPSKTSEAAEVLGGLGIPVVTFAGLGLGDRAPAGEVVQALIERSEDQDVAFAAFGYPFIHEGLISGILSRARTAVDLFPAASPLQVLLLALDIDATADLEIVDARSLPGARLARDAHLIITGIDNAILAHSVARELRSLYARDHSTVTAGRVEGGGFELMPTSVERLAGMRGVSRDMALYVPPVRIEPPDGFVELVRLIGVLRSPEGCPWDREQTHASLAQHMIEEAYEAASAIDAGDDRALTDELGDLLLQVVLHAQIAREGGRFDTDDVIASIITKVRRRHPHVFGTAVAETAEAVTRTWDAIKREEKPHRGALGEVPESLPALMRAQKISRRAAGVGFEWEDISGVWDKVHEEIDELRATELGTREAEDELGDLLFTVVNVARTMGIDAESALRRTCLRFTSRFEAMEAAASADGRPLEGLSLAEWEALWSAAKGSGRSGGE